jgi:N-methylhydantoinase A/oxoprolinase/acetone carboxylase beta subunit
MLDSDWNDRNFTDVPLVWSMRRGHMGDAEARAALAIINAYSRTFFDKYLKGVPAALLDSNSKSELSRVRVQRYPAE